MAFQLTHTNQFALDVLADLTKLDFTAPHTLENMLRGSNFIGAESGDHILAQPTLYDSLAFWIDAKFKRGLPVHEKESNPYGTIYYAPSSDQTALKIKFLHRYGRLEPSLYFYFTWNVTSSPTALFFIPVFNQIVHLFQLIRTDAPSYDRLNQVLSSVIPSGKLERHKSTFSGTAPLSSKNSAPIYYEIVTHNGIPKTEYDYTDIGKRVHVLLYARPQKPKAQLTFVQETS